MAEPTAQSVLSILPKPRLIALDQILREAPSLAQIPKALQERVEPHGCSDGRESHAAG